MLRHRIESSAIRWISAAMMSGMLVWPCALTPVAAARAEAPPPKLRAKELFKQSAERYRQGRFREALDLLTEAYALDPNPVLLYNMARALESLGEARRAIDTYQRYLEADPDAKDRGAIEQRIATLERQLAEKQALEKERDAASRRAARADKPRPAVREPSPLPWIVAGLGVTGLGLGLGFAVAAQARHNDAVEETTGRRSGELQAEGERFALVANIAFGIGGAAAIGGLVWGIVDVSRSGEPVVTVALVPAGGVLTCAF